MFFDIFHTCAHMHSAGDSVSVHCREQQTLLSTAQDNVPVAARTVPVIRCLELGSAIILEGTRRPGMSDSAVSIYVVV